MGAAIGAALVVVFLCAMAGIGLSNGIYSIAEFLYMNQDFREYIGIGLTVLFIAGVSWYNLKGG